jgi:hypothetical protein
VNTKNSSLTKVIVVRSPDFPNLKDDKASSEALVGNEGGVDLSPALHKR